MRRRGSALLLGVAALLFFDCGGTSVLSDDGSGGSTTTTASGTTGCKSHDDCGDDSVCIFSTGECAASCPGFCSGCSAGKTCNECATSSCPNCRDCTPACVPISDGQCDENDDCAGGDVCIFEQQRCAPPCDLNGGCADPGLVCQSCVTGSCCGCEDCVSACVAP